MKSGVNPIDPVQRLRNAPRCTAMAKRTGRRCRCPSKQGWAVCRLHGAGGGAPSGAAHPNYLHGLRSKEYLSVRRTTMALSKSIQELIKEME